MFKEERLNHFVKSMEEEINKHSEVYGDSWKTQNLEFLEQRLNVKVNEFRLTKQPRKLISLANLAMLLYTRLKEENGSY